MNRQEIVEQMYSLEVGWPDKVMLFAYSGILILVDTETLVIIDSWLIPCDGGNCNIRDIGEGMEKLELSD